MNYTNVYANQSRWTDIITFCEKIPDIEHIKSLAVLEVYALALAHVGNTGQSIEVYQKAF